MHRLATDTIDLAADVRAWIAEHERDGGPAPTAADRDATHAAFAAEFETRLVDVFRRLDEVGVPGTATTTAVPRPEDRAAAYTRGGRGQVVEVLFAMAAQLGRR